MHSTRLDLFDNSDFHPGSILKRLLWALLSGLFFQNWIPWPSQLKSTLLRIFGAQIGEGLILKPRVTIKYPWKLRVRDHVWIGENVWIDNLEEISIGSHVCISQGALLLCGNHDFKKSTFDLITLPIDLEDGVWIGAKCVVAPGVTCRSHSVLSLGSITTKDLEAWTVYQGNPATAKKPRSQNS